LLGQVARGDQEAVNALLPLVYDQLRTLAQRQLREERAGHTLQTTALVHEAYLHLVGHNSFQWKDRGHFLAIASRAMRQVLVNHAIGKRAQKRGGQHERVDLDEALEVFERRSIDLISLDEALKRLASIDQDQARLVELRFFGGLTIEEVSEVMQVPVRTLEREWAMARAWLRREIERA
jgi:RNA polymerase sigma factor (TIGR02999 family)